MKIRRTPSAGRSGGTHPTAEPENRKVYDDLYDKWSALYGAQ
jgi:hypothetical protein